MTVFFKSDQRDKLKTDCVAIIAEYFGVDTEQAESWCELSKGKVTIQLPFAAETQHRGVIEALNSTGVESDRLVIDTVIQAKATKVARLPLVKNIIAVASGKGGVGKSASSVNLAYALLQEGASVGILDADIYGPSIPIMLGNPDAHPDSEDQKHMFPLECEGLVANSVGYLVPADNASIWRGPMASRALQQLINETLWPELDYLVVDMPPGTGDIQLTLAQQVPVTAAVVVTTPQDLALADAVKGIAMFNKVDIPVLGVVENMSYHQCTHCGHKEHIFAADGGQKLAEKYQTRLLGQLPLDIRIREHADGGKPLLVSAPESPLADAYRAAARAISQQLALDPTIQSDNSIPIRVNP